MADESLGRLYNFLYRDRAEALGALLVQCAHSRIISAEFGVRSDSTSLETFDGSLSFV